jgi:lipopolysaccharide/colanic/teichoic acid biosynthesis glycosyltransferase
VLLVLSAPLLAVLIVVVRATSPGGGIYKQRRVGKHGKVFWLYKIRTMYANAEAEGPQWAKPKDSRTTPVGRALRFLHLDELPQLVNVVRGDMSLIGPRPERPEFVSELALMIANYEQRLKVLPGITGLAQINLPPDDSPASVEKKVIIDCHYIEHGDAFLDLRILLCTALRMMGIRHGRAPRWLGVEYRFPNTSRSLVETMEVSLDETVVGVRALRHGGRNGHCQDVGIGAAALELSTAGAGAASASYAGTDHRSTPRRPK